MGATTFTRYLDVHESEHVHIDPPQPLDVYVYSDGIVSLVSDEWALSLRPDGTVQVRRMNDRRRLCVSFSDPHVSAVVGGALNISAGLTSD